jgi:hypothetical protein
MGGQQSAEPIVTSQVKSSEIVAHAYLDVYQQINQAIGIEQTMTVNCAAGGKATCLKCLRKVIESANPTVQALALADRGDMAGEICRRVCVCEVEGVDLSQTGNINLQANATSDAAAAFAKAINDNLKIAIANAGGIYQDKRKQQGVKQTLTSRIYSSVTKDSFQKQLQVVSQRQSVDVDFSSGAGVAKNIKLSQAVDIVASALQRDQTIVGDLGELQQAAMEQLVAFTTQGLIENNKGSSSGIAFSSWENRFMMLSIISIGVSLVVLSEALRRRPQPIVVA